MLNVVIVGLTIVLCIFQPWMLAIVIFIWAVEAKYKQMKDAEKGDIRHDREALMEYINKKFDEASKDDSTTMIVAGTRKHPTKPHLRIVK